MDEENCRQYMLDCRGVYDPCMSCRGTGVKVYSSTALWRGGIGGQAMTNGPCDTCWGSGDRYRPWTDLRKLEAGMKAEIEKQAEAHFVDRMAGRWYQKKYFVQLVELLTKESKRRKVDRDYRDLCGMLARVLTGYGK
jgi:hypothetical protein